MRGVCILLLVAGVASAQEATAVSGTPDDATAVKGRLVSSGVFYGETSSNAGQDVSPQDLLYLDLRGRVDLAHIKGTHWEVLGDFRLRLSPSDQAARGWLGGSENDLTELWGGYRGDRLEVVAGRQIVRNVDATTIDGVSLALHTGPHAEIGVFAGLYPSPFSRRFEDDYPDAPGSGGLPKAAGAWIGYRFERAYGAVGFGVIDARELDSDPLREFVTSNGYWNLGDKIVLFHYASFDLDGPQGAAFTSLQVGATWRVLEPLRLEAAVSHMSTNALALYVRRYLEAVDPANVTRIQNNLFIARTAADEARVGADLTVAGPRLDLYGQLRVRERDVLTDPQLPATIAALPADQQVEAIAGVRQHDSLLGMTLGLNGSYLSGNRTQAETLSVRGQRGFMNDKLQLDADVTYLHWLDKCDTTNDPICTGTSSGDAFDAGATVIYAAGGVAGAGKGWLFLGDYHLSYQHSLAASAETILGHMLFLRAQRSF